MRAVKTNLQLLDRYPLFYFAILFLGASSIAFIIPLLSTYLIKGLGQQPWHLMMVMGGFSAVTLLINRLYGGLVDKGWTIKPLLVLSIAAFGSHALLQATVPSLLTLALFGIPLLGIGSGALSLMYSAGRLFAEQTGRDPGKFNLHMRICLSMAWVICPPLAFFLFGAFGFLVVHTIAFGCTVLWLALVLSVLPADFKSHRPASRTTAMADPQGANLLFIACIPVFALATANSLFLAAAPLYFLQELALPASTPGWALAVKSLFETIIILMVVKPTQRYGERFMMLLSSIGALVFFAAITSASSLPQILTLCVIEGMYYGICASVGITFIQNYALHKPGIATSYFVNALFLGGLAGNLLTGALASITTYQNTIFSSLALAFVAFTFLLLIKPPAEAELAAARS